MAKQLLRSVLQQATVPLEKGKQPSTFNLTAAKDQPHAKLITFVEGSEEVITSASDQEWFLGQCRGQALRAAMRSMEEQRLASVFGTLQDGEHHRRRMQCSARTSSLVINNIELPSLSFGDHMARPHHYHMS